MGSARRFPLDDPAAGPRADRAAPRRSPSSSSAEPQPKWPVLARIAEISKSSGLESGSADSTARATYRLDAPHASAPSPSHTTPPPQARPLQSLGTRRGERSEISQPAPDDAQRYDRVLQAVPLPIRITVEAWRIIQPHRELIRLAAMLTLMAAGGMSMVMMMGERPAPEGSPPRPATTTADHTTADEIDIQSVDLHRALEPATEPDTDTTSIAPTARGPLTPATQPLMAIESHAAPAASPYPTTSFAESPLPKAAGDSLPQVSLPPTSLPRAQMAEPGVAHLPGYLLETKTR